MSSLDPFDQIVEDLTNSGFSVSDGLFGDDDVVALAAAAERCQSDGRMAPARTGKDNGVDRSVRGDSIAWIDDDETNPEVLRCLATFEALRQVLNRRLFLNVHDIECHFASYPPGAVYQKHLDQFSTGDHRRRISLVLYLNQSWRSADGGALRLYLDETATDLVDISPVAGRLVLFESGRFWHEVQPSRRQRLSISGWFRTSAG